MKRIILMIVIAFSFSQVRAQVDTSFTTKFKAVSDACKVYKLASEEDKPDKMQLILDAMWNEFSTMSASDFSNKMTAMLNSSAELAKLSNPIGFTVCLGQAVDNFFTCQRYYHAGYPGHPTCIQMAIFATAGCINSYL